MKRFLQKTALLLLCLALLAGFSPFAEARDTLRVGIRPLGDGVITVDAAGNYYGIERVRARQLGGKSRAPAHGRD